MKNKYCLKFTGRYLIRVVTLLIAVSVVSFILVSHNRELLKKVCTGIVEL